MRAIHIQRSSGFDHDVQIQEDLYIPQLEISFYVRAENLYSEHSMGKMHHREMPSDYREDLVLTAQGNIPKRPYHISIKREVDLSDQDIKNLDAKLVEYLELAAAAREKQEALKPVADTLFSLIA